MPTVNLNRHEVEKLVGKKLELEALKDRISMLGTDLDDITDDEIIVEIFPNRPDMLSEQGFARALSSFIGVKTGLKEFKIVKSKNKVIAEKSLPKEWPYCFACIVKNLKFDSEKIIQVVQIQEKLGVSLLRNRKKGGIGLYPLEKIKFPVRFVGMNPDEIRFRPLEYPDEITGREILSKHPKGKTYGKICESWSKFPVFMDSNNVIMSMPPIINSHDVGKIDETTKDVFVEITGNDLETVKKALIIMATALSDMGGTVYSLENIDQKNDSLQFPDLMPEKMKLNLDYANKMLGLDLKENEIKTLLERMGYNYSKGTVEIPAYRADILHEIDLIEDIAIAYGYENFKEEIPDVSTIGEESQITKFKRKVAEILIGLELIECSSFHLSNQITLNEKMNSKNKLITVESAVNTDYDTLRNSLIPNLMEILSRNKRYEYPQNIFEIGTVFEEGDTETGIKESESLSVLKCGKEVNFTGIKQVLDVIMNSLEIEHVKRVVAALSKRETYPESVDNVNVINTAVSCVFLTGEHAYKINKPLNLGFLDYSTLEKRKEILEKELELNSILCPEIYKEVLPITEDNGEIKIAGDGKIIEYALKMKEFPQEGILTNLLKEEKASKEHVLKIAKKIAGFHRITPTSEEIQKYGSYDAVKELWDEIFKQAKKFADEAVDKDQYGVIKERVTSFLMRNRDFFENRVKEGKIKYTHGDFHSANICVAEDIHIFDRIVFNMKFPCSDTAAEVAFLAMDLDFHKQPELSIYFVQEYLKETQDHNIIHLLDFYKCFRAAIRGEIACFKSEDKNFPEK